MKIKEVSLGKEFKIGLQNYSNITLRCDLKWELSENEEPDWNSMWDEINRQLSLQSSDLDPSWMSDSKEYKNFFRIVVKQPKLEGGK